MAERTVPNTVILFKPALSTTELEELFADKANDRRMTDVQQWITSQHDKQQPQTTNMFDLEAKHARALCKDLFGIY